MQSIIHQPRFDFLYGDIPFESLSWHKEESRSGDQHTTVYTLEDGLKITNILTWHGDACEWVNWFEHTGDAPSQIISNLLDACVTLPMPHEEFYNRRAWQQDFADVTQIYAPSGSTWAYDEFSSYPHRMDDVRYIGQGAPNRSRKYATSGGRSSEKNAPFFNIHFQGQGYIAAIGWSGQWNCEIRRIEDGVIIKSGIEDTHFRLLPGEKFRTSSIVIMPYKGTVIDGQNQWRKLVREHYSLIGQQGRDAHGPLCASLWGGMRSESALARIKTILDNKLSVEYIWMDAGWYGIDTQATPDEFEGDWAEHTGDWRVSPHVHPNALRDVADFIHESGMKFLLWFEPERVIATTPIVEKHPEYFFIPAYDKSKNRLLNLGNPQAWQYCYETVAGLIESIGVDGYRQDFNMPPLKDWRNNDTEDRQGISEILHINGLYQLWDALLARFPHLLIDNCASGGRRIDIETLRRSIPLWRSDYECSANYLTEGSQCHHLAFNQWMPYSGTGGGRPYDTYRLRSAYSPALNLGYTFSERDSFGGDPEKMAWLHQRIQEYKKVRAMMTEDFYPLTQITDCTDAWAAVQFDRPSQKDGVIQAFRRENSPFETACLPLYAITEQAQYLFTDEDTGEETVLSGKVLKEQGFAVTIPEKRGSKLIFYRQI